MKAFIARHSERIRGALSGFDRLVFRGTLRRISFAQGLMGLLWKRKVLLKEFGAFAERETARLRAASEHEARRLGRPVIYLPSSETSKEAEALKIARRDGISKGLIAVITSTEPCFGFDVYKNRSTKMLELVSRKRKCLHIYHYWMDPTFGFMYGRIQTWFPFSIQIGINGREWLAHQMDGRGIRYKRRDNCFTQIEDLEAAQELMHQQLTTDWPAALGRVAGSLNPAHGAMFQDFPVAYYWSAWQSEWATDLMFKSAGILAEIYPALVMHGITTFSSPDVMRFLGRRFRGDFEGAVVSDFKERPEGVRIKHRAGGNSVKLYDKEGSVLRAETTINHPEEFKIFRPKEADPDGPPAWRTLRRGISDLHRRSQVSQACNDRYLSALAAVDTSIPIGDLIGPFLKPKTSKNMRLRALRPWAEPDMTILRTIARGEFNIRGFRNRDLQQALFTAVASDPSETRKRSARVTRILRLLRGHGLIQRISGTHRYRLTARAQQFLPAVLAVERVTLQRLNAA